jgi:hypothetical protein
LRPVFVYVAQKSQRDVILFRREPASLQIGMAELLECCGMARRQVDGDK